MKQLIYIIALGAMLIVGACRNHNRDIIAKAAEEINSPEAQRELLATPGLTAISSTFDADSLCIDVRFDDTADIRSLDPEMLGRLFVDQYLAQGMDRDLVDALRAEDVSIVLHITGATTAAPIRVSIPPAQLTAPER